MSYDIVFIIVVTCRIFSLNLSQNFSSVTFKSNGSIDIKDIRANGIWYWCFCRLHDLWSPFWAVGGEQYFQPKQIQFFAKRSHLYIYIYYISQLIYCPSKVWDQYDFLKAAFKSKCIWSQKMNYYLLMQSLVVPHGSSEIILIYWFGA